MKNLDTWNMLCTSTPEKASITVKELTKAMARLPPNLFACEIYATDDGIALLKSRSEVDHQLHVPSLVSFPIFRCAFVAEANWKARQAAGTGKITFVVDQTGITEFKPT